MNWSRIANEVFINIGISTGIILAFVLALFYVKQLKEKHIQLRWFHIIVEVFGGLLFASFLTATVFGSTNQNKVIWFITFAIPAMVGAIFELGRKERSD